MNGQCAMKDLRAGMVLSKAVYSADGRVLVEEGTVLTDYLIKNLRERSLIAVMIQKPERLVIHVEEPEPPEPEEAPAPAEPEAETPAPLEEENIQRVKADPEHDALLDPAYVSCYMSVLRQLRAIFAQRGAGSRRKSGRLSVADHPQSADRSRAPETARNTDILPIRR